MSVELPTVCPAAEPLPYASGMGRRVICHVMRLDRQRATGIGITAGQLAMERDADDGVLLSEERDAGGVYKLCCGRGVPALDPEDQSESPHYTRCPIWAADREREWAGADSLGDMADEADTYATPDFAAEPAVVSDGGFMLDEEGWE